MTNHDAEKVGAGAERGEAGEAFAQMFDPREDSYALDDTRAGRIAQAAFVGVALAIPNLVRGTGKRAAAYAATGVSFAALVAYLNAQEEEEELTPAAPPEPSNPAWQVVAALTGGAVATTAAALGGAALLRKAGVAKPWRALGVVGAGVTFVASELAARHD